FPVRAIETRRLSASETAHERQLTAVVNAVRQDRTPQDVANGHRPGEKLNRLIEILWLQLSNSIDRLTMNLLVLWCERVHGARTLDVGRLGPTHRELPLVDAVADVGVTLCQVPCEFTEGSAGRIRPEVILRRRERFQQLDRV